MVDRVIDRLHRRTLHYDFRPYARIQITCPLRPDLVWINSVGRVRVVGPALSVACLSALAVFHGYAIVR